MTIQNDILFNDIFAGNYTVHQEMYKSEVIRIIPGRNRDKIERLRTRMYDLDDAGANYNELLKASQELDKFIVMYYRVVG